MHEIDFLNKLSVLLKEAFLFKKYKAMSPVAAVFVGVLMLPFVVASFFVTVAFASIAFMYKILSAPAKFSHDLLHEEGQSVMHATQTIIYCISWSFVIFLYVMMSLLLFMILPMYALLSVLLYVWTLGGFKFHLFADKIDDISITVNGKFKSPLLLTFIFLGLLITVIVPAAHGFICYIDLYKDFMEKLFAAKFIPIYLKYFGAHVLFSFLYSIIGFSSCPKQETETNE
jgi:hypothetical protein